MSEPGRDEDGRFVTNDKTVAQLLELTGEGFSIVATLNDRSGAYYGRARRLHDIARLKEIARVIAKYAPLADAGERPSTGDDQ